MSLGDSAASCQNSFTAKRSNKFVVTSSLKTSSHFKHVATPLCEIFGNFMFNSVFASLCGIIANKHVRFAIH